MKTFLLCVLFFTNLVNAQSWANLYGCYKTIEHNGQKVMNSGLNLTRVDGAISFTFLDLNSQIIPVHRFRVYTGIEFDYIEIFQNMGKHTLSTTQKEFSFYDLLRYGYAPEQIYHVDSHIQIKEEDDMVWLTVKNIVSEAGSLNLDEQYLLKKTNCL